MAQPDLTIYHNSRCSKSRGALELLREQGIEPTIINYLDQPPTVDQLRELLAKLGLGPRDVLRRGEAAYRERGLADPTLTDAQILAAIAAEPRLLERPIVVSGDRAVLARPPERVLELLVD